MKKSLTLLTLIFTLNANFCFSQSLYKEEKTGNTEEVKKDYVLKGVIGQIGTEFYALVTKENDLFLEKWDADLNLILSQKIKTITANDGTDLIYANPIILNNKLFLLYSTFEKSTKKSTFYSQELDLKDMKGMDKPKLITSSVAPETDNKMMMGVGGFGMDNIMKESRQMMVNMQNMFIISPDKTKILIYSSPSYNDKTNPDIVSAVVLDQEMNILWQKADIKLTVLSTDFDISKIKLNNEGDIYISGIEYTNKKTLKTGLDFDHYNHLISIKENGKAVHDYLLNEKFGFVYTFDFNFTKSNQVKLAGFYSAKGRSYVDGIFTAEIDPKSNDFANTEKNEIRFNFTFYGKGKADSGTDLNQKAKGLDFVIDNIFVHDDGSFTMVSERLITGESNLLGNNRSPFTINVLYEFKDIIVSRIDSKGIVSWNTMVNKNHTSAYAMNGYNFSFLEKNKTIYIIHNDNPDNFEEADKSKYDNLVMSSEINTIITRINPEGEKEQEILHKRAKTDLKPFNYLPITSNGIMIYSRYLTSSNNSANKFQISFVKF